MFEYSDSEFLKEIRYETFTPGGPGGQHANRTSSAVRAVHRPSGLSAIAREHRSQHRNRELATARLLAKLKARHRPARPRIPTSVPPYATALRRQGKEHRSRLKAERRKVSDD
jgi:protein subunit release factor B